MTGTKFGCGVAQCGAAPCMSTARRRATCVLPISDAAGREITTIEAIGNTPEGKAVQMRG